MRKIMAAAIVVCCSSIVGVPHATAQVGDTRQIQVTASVLGSCRFVSTLNLDFGSLDPANAVDKKQSVNVTFKCTKGVAYTFTVGNGLHALSGTNRMKSASVSDYVPYVIDPKSLLGTGKGFGTSEAVTLTGTVKGTDYLDATVGAYSDTVILTIQP